MEDCHFCLDNNKLQGEIWLENEMFYLVSSWDKLPRHAGMIIPKRHLETPFDFTESEWLALRSTILAAKQLLDSHNPDGYNLGWNVGTVGGQHVMHAHLHIMPRFANEPFAGKGIRAAFKT